MSDKTYIYSGHEVRKTGREAVNHDKFTDQRLVEIEIVDPVKRRNNIPIADWVSEKELYEVKGRRKSESEPEEENKRVRLRTKTWDK